MTTDSDRSVRLWFTEGELGDTRVRAPTLDYGKVALAFMATGDGENAVGRRRRTSPMARSSLTFQISELPDVRRVSHRARAGRDVASAVWGDWTHFLRTVSSFPEGSVTAEIRFCYRPQAEPDKNQDRLRLYVTVYADGRNIADRIASLIHSGPFSRFYTFSPSAPPPIEVDTVHAVGTIFRGAQLVRPLHGSEFNPSIPNSYLDMQMIEANDENDLLVVDQVLGNIDEPIDILIRVESVDASPEAHEHTAYLARLHSINRGREENEGPEDIDYLGDGDGRPYSALRVAPLRYRDPLADDILRAQQRFHEQIREPQLLFDIRVLARTPVVAHLVSSVVAESAFVNGSYQLFTCKEGEPLFAQAVEGARAECISPLPIYRTLWQDGADAYEGLLRLASIGTVDELSGAFRLPVASRWSPCCIRKDTDPPSENIDDMLVLGFDQEPATGGRRDRGRGLPRGISLRQLEKHLAVLGMPGTGKTTLLLAILLQLEAWGIPFTLIETAKREYRVLKTFTSHPRPETARLAAKLEVYTVGGLEPSPFRYNPLELQPWMSRCEHVENLMNCFQAGMSLPGPLMPVIRKSLDRVYDDHPDPARPPVIADLVAAAQEVLAEEHYTGETDSNLRAALSVRLGSLCCGSIGKLFQCRRGTPTIEHLLEASSIQELDALPPDQKCFVTLILLTAIWEYVKAAPRLTRKIRHVIIIEEAHNVVGRNTDARAAEEIADPKAHAAALISKMLAELRAARVPIILANQLASAVAPDVLKNTASKITFREVEKDEREAVGGAMLCGDSESEELARLRTGEAFFLTEGYHDPRRIWTVNLHQEMDLGRPPTDVELRSLIGNDEWFRQAAALRSTNEFFQLTEATNSFDDNRRRMTTRAMALCARYPKVLNIPAPAKRRMELAALAREARALRQALMAAQKSFLRGSYRAFRPVEPAADEDTALSALTKQLLHRVENVFPMSIQSCVRVLEALIVRCFRQLA